MKKELLNKFSKVLNDRKNNIISEISKFAQMNADGEYEVIHKEYGNSDDENSEESTDTMEDETMLNHLESELDNINVALERINDGTYGKCSKCNAEIDEKRLEYNPAAINCSVCQSKIEKDII